MPAGSEAARFGPRARRRQWRRSTCDRRGKAEAKGRRKKKREKKIVRKRSRGFLELVLQIRLPTRWQNDHDNGSSSSKAGRHRESWRGARQIAGESAANVLGARKAREKGEKGGKGGERGGAHTSLSTSTACPGRPIAYCPPCTNARLATRFISVKRGTKASATAAQCLLQ